MVNILPGPKDASDLMKKLVTIINDDSLVVPSTNKIAICYQHEDNKIIINLFLDSQNIRNTMGVEVFLKLVEGENQESDVSFEFSLPKNNSKKTRVCYLKINSDNDIVECIYFRYGKWTDYIEQKYLVIHERIKKTTKINGTTIDDSSFFE